MADSDLPPLKFANPDTTAKGEARASVHWRGLKTLWLNTGTLCNIECVNCYIESSPKNDRLVYLSLADVTPYLDEIDDMGQGAIEIGVTGGEPFLAPEILDILSACLSRGHHLLVLTNAMRPMMRPRIQDGLKALNAAYGERLKLRVSLDHHTQALHDAERGAGSFTAALEGLDWLGSAGIKTALAGRMALTDSEADSRAGYLKIASDADLAINPDDPGDLVLFPEMIPGDDPPEITTACWDILSKDPADIMCASQRMVVRRKGEGRATVAACTLLPYDSRFDLGPTLKGATDAPVSLNHPWCASFCVLGGGSCSA
ncbi:MAG: radical SAM protein [Pseudomonadota bacterium]